MNAAKRKLISIFLIVLIATIPKHAFAIDTDSKPEITYACARDTLSSDNSNEIDYSQEETFPCNHEEVYANTVANDSLAQTDECIKNENGTFSTDEPVGLPSTLDTSGHAKEFDLSDGVEQIVQDGQITDVLSESIIIDNDDVNDASLVDSLATQAVEGDAELWRGLYQKCPSLDQCADKPVVLRFTDSEYVLGAGVTPSNGSRVSKQQVNDSIGQRFRIHSVSESIHCILDIQSNLALSIRHDAQGKPVLTLMKNSGAQDQQWRIMLSDPQGACFRLNNLRYGNLRIITNESESQSQQLVDDTIHTDVSLFQIYEPVQLFENGTYEIGNKTSSNYVVDVSKGKLSNGSNIQLWQSNGSDAQSFNMTWDDRSGYYCISVASKPNYVLDAAGGGIKSGTNVQLYRSNNTEAQLWSVAKNTIDKIGFDIRNAKSGLNLGINRGWAVKACNVALYAFDGKPMQSWIIKGDGYYNYPELLNDGVKGTSDVYLNKEAQAYALWNEIYRAAANVKDAQNGSVVICMANTGYVFDPKCGSTEAGTAVQLYSSNDTINQRFSIVEVTDGIYQLIGIKSNLALTVKGSLKNGSQVVLSKRASDIRQYWRLSYDEKTMFFTVTCAYADKLFLCVNGSPKTGAQLVVKSSAPAMNRRFQLYRPQMTAVEGSYTLTNKANTKLVADVASGKIVSGTNIRLWNTNQSAAQRFKLTWDSTTGYYLISPDANDYLALDVAGGSTKDGANVRLYKSNGTAAQRWIVRFMDDGSGYSIQSAKCGLQLSSQSNKLVKSNNVCLHYASNIKSRSWILKRDAAATVGSSSEKLKIQTDWYGRGETYEAYHPKVVALNEYWNGYKYWMAFTPYPKASSSFEDPCIVASNDLTDWSVPTGLANPIDDMHDDGISSAYNSDTHLLYNPDMNRLELFWRRVEYQDWFIYRSCSTDGVTWSEKEVVMNGVGLASKDALSPAVVYEDGTYKIWYVSDRDGSVRYAESKDCKSWGTATEVIFPFAQTALATWHLDVEKTKNGYEALLSATDERFNHDRMSVWYSISNDGITGWSVPDVIVEPQTGTEEWDNLGTYRSCLLHIDDTYYVFYSGISTSFYRGVGLAVGTNIYKLRRLSLHK